jgi:hypothetical protein
MSQKAGTAPRRTLPVGESQGRIDRLIQRSWESFRKGRPAAPGRSIVITLDEAAMHQIWTEHLARWCYYYEPVLLEGISGKLKRGRGLKQPQLEYLSNLKRSRARRSSPGAWALITTQG